MKFHLILTLALATTLAGCNQFLAERLVSAPNKALRENKPATPADQAADGKLRIAVRPPDAPPGSPPDATIALWIREPAAGTPVCGTILVLHGFMVAHFQLEMVADRLRDEGYRAVLVDLRGHGESTGDTISYGIQDARDLAQVTTELQRRGLCGPTVGVFGTSYGASTAILFAAEDPRVDAVVAVAPFATLRDAAPRYGRHLVPIPGLFLSDTDYHAVVDIAGKLANFNPDTESPVARIKNARGRILLVHGELDYITPASASRKLHAASPQNSELLIFPAEGHIGLSFDVAGTLNDTIKQWFERTHAGAMPN